MIPQIFGTSPQTWGGRKQSLISAARRKGACAQALATLEAAESLDELEKEGQLFVWVLWASNHEVVPKELINRYYRWCNGKGLYTWEAYNAAREEMKQETIKAARLWIETGALS